MIRGLYTAAAGMLSNLMRHESIVHNLANVQTTGYKADRATLTDFPSLLLHEIRGGESGPEIGRAGTGVSMAALVTDFSVGAFQLTDHPYDFAVGSDGFFQVQTPDGVRYTRDGRFHRDSDGRLVTADGYLVMGSNGPISLPDGQLTVSTRGELFVEDALVGQLALVRFDDTADLLKDGQTTFVNQQVQPADIPAEEAEIYQGYLEDSNVDTAQTVTEMTSVLRAYQASQRLVQFQDQINARTVGELGRV
ncbi:MAG: flagellar hook-basal body protein [Anaerolineae bacterium]|nr:flagellar hook-basal body protein [Anaerolineae bacterium]